MRSKFGLLFVGVVLFGMISAASAMADMQGPEWIMEGGGTSVVYDFNLVFGGGAVPIGNSFGLTDVAGDNYTPLIGTFQSYSTINVLHSDPNYFAIIDAASVNLGATPAFKFSFFNGAYDPNYSVSSTALGSGLYSYTLSNETTGMIISFNSKAIPSAVPIPASALLLGSGLLGLLGIGSRKKKV